MAKEKPSAHSVSVQIREIAKGEAGVRLIGTTPFIFNCMSDKAWRQLLLPAGRRSRSELESSLKHNPPEEYRSSVYTVRDDSSPTLLGFPCTGFKGAMSTAAKELDVFSTKVDRLIDVSAPHMRGNLVPMYGVPQLFMSVVRSADQAKTPDIRTRAILPVWGCEITIHYVKPQFTETAIMNLIAGAGIFIGVGDFRQEKGGGNHGLWNCSVSDAEWRDLVKEGSRRAQTKALANPVCYDEQSERMLAWFGEEVKTRGRHEQIKPSEAKPRRKSNGGVEVGENA